MKTQQGSSHAFIPCRLENMSRNSTRLMTNLNEWQMMKMSTMMERLVATSRLRRMRLFTTILLLRLTNQSRVLGPLHQSEPSTGSAPPMRAEYWVRSTNESPPDVHEGEGVEDGEDDQREQVEDGETQQGTHLWERTF